jgi:selenocysteine lyase/cysteine desulfurase
MLSIKSFFMFQHQRALFDLPEDITYLNCAYMSPQPKVVTHLGQQLMTQKAQPHQVQISDFFEPVQRLKEGFSRLVNIDNPNRVAILPSVSYGIAVVSKNIALRAGQNIVVVAEQFPSNIYSWQKLAEENGAHIRFATIPNDTLSRSAGATQAILDAIDEQTAVVAIAHIHWADGTRYDLAAIRDKAKACGALLVLDGTQSVGALPFDVAQIQPDALICAGYKWLMGPYSIGLGYFGPAFDGGEPIEENWINRHNSEDFTGLVNYQPRYQPLAGRYSVGEQSNFMLVPMLAAGIELLLDLGVANIQSYTKQIAAPILSALKKMGAGVEAEADRCGHLFGIRLQQHFDVERLKRALAEARVFVSFRGDAIRVAPHVYNTTADFDRLLACFKAAQL